MDWIATTETVGGLRPGICHRHNRADVRIWGKYGFIIESPNGRFVAAILNHRVYNNNFLAMDEAPQPRGAEAVYAFGEEEFTFVVRTLQIPILPQDQIAHAAAWEASVESHKPHSFKKQGSQVAESKEV